MTAARSDGLLRVVLQGDAAGHPDVPFQQRDREQATHDLTIGGHFALAGVSGPYVLHLAVQAGRLMLAVHDADDTLLRHFVFALSPFRRLIKDYQLLVESYEVAMQDHNAARVQTIDMGRRSLHNEGAELMIERLRGKIDVDLETARRLFTLVCVLHRRI
ncbi:UPF0262 family protein [Lichenicoccus sp.]|uniref:UPF0262 family protein n=1 Tax=Lichenicoccus sp. TaxID=2781899 RepID=UPI003D140FAF